MMGKGILIGLVFISSQWEVLRLKSARLDATRHKDDQDDDE